MDASKTRHRAAPIGYFSPESTIWQVNREAVLMLGSGRALLMQAAHPLAVNGVARHSNYHDDPWGRLDRTMAHVWTVVYGSRGEADQVGREVKAMHARVNGRTTEGLGQYPAGTPYSALDPELLLWVQATLVDTALTAYETWVRPLSDAERESYYQDASLEARILGTPDSVIPPTYNEFREYLDERLASDEICVTEPAREIARWVMQPPLPLVMRPAWSAFNLATVAMLPASLREQYGFPWGPARRSVYAGSRTFIRNVMLPLLPDRWRAIEPARQAERAIREDRRRTRRASEPSASNRLRPVA